MQFDLQAFLRDMKEEQKEDHDRLEKKIDEALDTLNNHETRLVVVENTRKAMLWLGTTLLLAFLGIAGDLVVTHFKG